MPSNRKRRENALFFRVFIRKTCPGHLKRGRNSFRFTSIESYEFENPDPWISGFLGFGGKDPEESLPERERKSAFVRCLQTFKSNSRSATLCSVPSSHAVIIGLFNTSYGVIIELFGKLKMSSSSF